MVNFRYKYSLVDLQDHGVPCVVPCVLDSRVDDFCLLGQLRGVKTADLYYFGMFTNYEGMLAYYTCVSVGV